VNKKYHERGWCKPAAFCFKAYMKSRTEKMLKGLILIYSVLGVLIILAIALICFILPLFSPNESASPDVLGLLEKVLLAWGLILLPFLKIAQVYMKKRWH